MDDERVCNECGQAKPLHAFRRCKDNRPGRGTRGGNGGYRPTCRACLKARDRRKKGMPTMEELHARKEARLEAEARRSEIWTAGRRRIRDMVEKWLLDHPKDKALPIPTLRYRARYEYDGAFRAKEIKRAHARKACVGWIDDGSLTGQVVRQLFAKAKRCPVCKCRMRSKDKSLDHIVPKSRGGWHSLLNVRVICKTCNARKHATMPEQLTLAS